MIACLANKSLTSWSQIDSISFDIAIAEGTNDWNGDCAKSITTPFETVDKIHGFEKISKKLQKTKENRRNFPENPYKTRNLPKIQEN